MRVVPAAVVAALMSFAAGAQTLVTTEEYPPFNMTEQGEVVGVSTALVRRMFERAGLAYRIQMLPWQRAYALALAQPGTCVYSTTETDERKPLFEWVGPLVVNSWTLFARADTALTIGRLEDARGHRIGGYQGDATAVFLQGQGYDVDAAPSDDLNPAKLMAGRIDLWATGSELGPYLARHQGITAIKPLFAFKDVVLSLACNRATEAQTLDGLRAALAAERREAAARR
jgi:polar amino acid transport system substrate-binding protein